VELGLREGDKERMGVLTRGKERGGEEEVARV